MLAVPGAAGESPEDVQAVLLQPMDLANVLKDMSVSATTTTALKAAAVALPPVGVMKSGVRSSDRVCNIAGLLVATDNYLQAWNCPLSFSLPLVCLRHVFPMYS